MFEERSNNFRCPVVVVFALREEERERTERGKKRTREWIVDDDVDVDDVGAAERRFELRHERRRE